jgi:hypothetical protein
MHKFLPSFLPSTAYSGLPDANTPPGHPVSPQAHSGLEGEPVRAVPVHVWVPQLQCVLVCVLGVTVTVRGVFSDRVDRLLVWLVWLFWLARLAWRERIPLRSPDQRLRSRSRVYEPSCPSWLWRELRGDSGKVGGDPTPGVDMWPPGWPYRGGEFGPNAHRMVLAHASASLASASGAVDTLRAWTLALEPGTGMGAEWWRGGVGERDSEMEVCERYEGDRETLPPREDGPDSPG